MISRCNWSWANELLDVDGFLDLLAFLLSFSLFLLPLDAILGLQVKSEKESSQSRDGQCAFSFR